MQEIPVRQQLILMKFRPCLDQATLLLWKVPGPPESMHESEQHGASPLLRKTF